MKELINKFFEAYMAEPMNRMSVYIPAIPEEMIVAREHNSDWIEWRLLHGTLTQADYRQVERDFNVKFPNSFIEWHKEYYFLRIDCGILRLPESNPNQPLRAVKENLKWFLAEQLIPQKLYPFGDAMNDEGPLVFDGRIDVPGNEFPIRVYDHELMGDLEGLGPVIFSSFERLLACLTFYLNEVGKKPYEEVMAEFCKMDPAGAGSTGLGYWL